MRKLVPLAAVAGIAFAAGAAFGERVPTNAGGAHTVAERILGAAQLPANATRSSTDPSGSRLAKPGTYPLTPDLVDLHSFWRVPGDPQSVGNWIADHPPAGTKSSEAAETGRNGSIVSAYKGFVLLGPVSGGAPSETLLFTLVAARGGGTAVRVDAQVVWLLERPASERIPRGVDAVTVDVRGATGFHRFALLAEPRKARRAAAILNRLPAAQPGPVACPNDSGPWVTLAFFKGHTRLATARVDGSGCLGVNLWIRGRREHPLQGNSKLLGELSSALGISLR